MKRSTDIYFTSITGNTKSMSESLSSLMDRKYGIEVGLHEVDDNTLPTEINDNYFVIVPTYLEGGNGIDNGDQEILTEPLGELIEYKDNQDKLLGIVGSGNRNFASQFCLTAKQYASKFNSEVIYETELRGTDHDLDEIATIMIDKMNKAER